MTAGSSIPARDGNGETECEHEWTHVGWMTDDDNVVAHRYECRDCSTIQIRPVGFRGMKKSDMVEWAVFYPVARDGGLT